MKIRYITILLLLFTIYSVFLSNITKEINIKGPDLITMNSRKIVSSNSISPYKTTDTYVSDIEKVDFKFTSVGISWYEYLPLGTKVEMSVKFLVDDEWTEWIETDEDLDLFENGSYRFIEIALKVSFLNEELQLLDDTLYWSESRQSYWFKYADRIDLLLEYYSKTLSVKDLCVDVRLLFSEYKIGHKSRESFVIWTILTF